MFGRPGRVNQGEIPLYQELQRDFSEEVSQVLWFGALKGILGVHSCKPIMYFNIQ